MSQKHDDYRSVYSLVNTEDRFMALEEVKELLRSRFVNLYCMFEILFKSDDGCIDFNFGDIAIQFVRGFGVWSERKDVVQMTIEVQKDGASDAVGYEYMQNELWFHLSRREFT
jgi:hypothetical protein